MKDFVYGVACALLVVAFVADYMCEQNTHDRCTLGFPNPVKAKQ